MAAEHEVEAIGRVPNEFDRHAVAINFRDETEIQFGFAFGLGFAEAALSGAF